jgi:hypothetical protein
MREFRGKCVGARVLEIQALQNSTSEW